MKVVKNIITVVISAIITADIFIANAYADMPSLNNYPIVDVDSNNVNYIIVGLLVLVVTVVSIVVLIKIRKNILKEDYKRKEKK